MFSATAGDSLSGHCGAAFSTKDNDNGQSSSNCAVSCGITMVCMERSILFC